MFACQLDVCVSMCVGVCTGVHVCLHMCIYICMRMHVGNRGQHCMLLLRC